MWIIFRHIVPILLPYSFAVMALSIPGVIVYEGFPADLLYEFRLYSLGTQVVIYATIGVVFAAMVSRLLGEKKQTVHA